MSISESGHLKNGNNYINIPLKSPSKLTFRVMFTAYVMCFKNNLENVTQNLKFQQEV